MPYTHPKREAKIYLWCAHIPANKQVWFILNKTLQLNTVVSQSILSLHTVTGKEQDSHKLCCLLEKTEHFLGLVVEPELQEKNRIIPIQMLFERESASLVQLLRKNVMQIRPYIFE